ncbi:MAG: alpha/beta hydrolase [Pseudomonadota bacterium]|nr:alpha/beta hydrolase [Pseudomonadota bacterium]
MRNVLHTIVAAGMMAATTLWASSAAADIHMAEKGEGPALVFIPGLNSGAETFTETCEAFAATHRCLLLELPGFAGQPPVDLSAGFLVPMRDDVIALLRANDVNEATLVGHSLGGDLAMMIALEAPELVNRLVLIDSLPFYAAIQNPAATAETMQQVAAMMRAQMNAQSDEQYKQAAVMSTAGMTRSAERHAQLNEWTLASDRATTTAAMIDLLTTDLRTAIAGIEEPILVLGSWAAYAQYGSTLDSTRDIFRAQYAAAPNVDVQMSEAGYHFLTWDDGAWVNERIAAFIAE